MFVLDRAFGNNRRDRRPHASMAVERMQDPDATSELVLSFKIQPVEQKGHFSPFLNSVENFSNLRSIPHTVTTDLR